MALDVPDEERDIYDPNFVADLFDRCAGHYRRWAAVASFGFVSLWRRQCAARLPGQIALSRHKGAFLNSRTPEIVDLMAGTGEVWPHILRLYPEARITAIDISPEMHAQALTQLHGPYAHRIKHIAADALQHELAPASADIIVATFGLKTLTPAGQDVLARQIAGTLRPGGAFSLIEASDPKDWVLRPLYRFHLDTVLPLIERLFLKGAQDFSMLGTYTRSFGDCSHFAESLRREGLFVSQRQHFFGCATSVAGFKPLAEPPPSP